MAWYSWMFIGRALRLGIDQRHEIGHTRDLYAFELAKSKESPVASDDIPRPGRDGAFENTVVVWVLRDRVDALGRGRDHRW